MAPTSVCQGERGELRPVPERLTTKESSAEAPQRAVVAGAAAAGKPGLPGWLGRVEPREPVRAGAAFPGPGLPRIPGK